MITQPVKKKNKDLNLGSLIQMANKHMKRSSTSLIIREMKIKATMRYHFMLVRMTIIKKKKKSTNNKYQKVCEEKGILLHC